MRRAIDQETKHAADCVYEAIEKNILLQINNLKTYPGVQERLKNKKLAIHGLALRI